VIVLALFGSGAIAGTLGALLGLGGGVFLVPLLVLLFELPIRFAVGTSLVGVIATSAAVAIFTGSRRGADMDLALRLELSTAAGALAGGWLAGLVDPRALYVIFALVVFASAGYTLREARQRAGGQAAELLYRRDYRIRRWPAGLAVSSLAGLASGMLGVGGGFIKVPIMHSLMGVPLGIATATSNFMVGITASASVFVYYHRGDIRPWMAVPATLGVFAGAMLGVLLQPRLRAGWLRAVLVLVLIGIGIQMLVRGLS